MITDHLPALLVVLPLLAAPLCWVLPGSRAAWYLAMVTAWLVLALAAAILSQVHSNGISHYAMGGWRPPWGIEYRIDLVSAYVALVIAGVAAVVLPFAGLSVASEVAADNVGGIYAAWLLSLAGLLGITVTGDVFNLFVFLEIASLAAYILVSQGRDRRALVAAFQYLVMGTIGATFLLIGIGLLYAMTGTLNMADLAGRLPGVSHTRAVHTAFAFIAVGLSIKLALYPLHRWLPNAYTQAPSAASAFLAGTSTKVAIYALIRFIYGVFGWQFVSQQGVYAGVLLVLALAAIVSGSVTALFQSNVKRLLAYSSVAQIGYIVLGVVLGTVAGLSAGLLHLFNHALIKAGLFLSVGCVFYRLGSVRLADMRGVGREMPWTTAAFVISGLSLIGVPLTSGFTSKWLLVSAVLERGWWPLALLVLLASLAALAYVWRVVEAMCFQGGERSRHPLPEAPLWLLLPTCLVAAANVFFGIYTDLNVGLAQRAAASLFGAGAMP